MTILLITHHSFRIMKSGDCLEKEIKLSRCHAWNISCTATFKRLLKTHFLNIFYPRHKVAVFNCIDSCIARRIRFVVGLALNTYDDDDDDEQEHEEGHGQLDWITSNHGQSWHWRKY